MRGFTTITAAPALDVPYIITLPSAADIISSFALGINETISCGIINDTVNDARVVPAAPTDSIAPLDVTGAAIIPAHIMARINARAVSLVPPVVSYLLESSGSSLASNFALVDNFAALPPIGRPDIAYCTADTNALYRWESTIITTYDWVVGTQAGDDFADLALALASPLVLTGHKIFIRDGTYTHAAAININKGVKIFGQTRAGAILRTPGGAGDPSQFILVAADNVAICNLTIQHRKTSNSSVDSAVQMAAHRAGFIMDGCTCVYEEFGVVVRSTDWKLNDVYFDYRGDPCCASYRSIGVYESHGNGFITGCTFDNTSLTSGTSRAILETLGPTVGALVFEDNTTAGPLTQFSIMESFVGAPGSLSIIAKRNVLTEVNAFFAFWSATAGYGDLFAQMVASNNTITNAHGKGTFGIDGPAAPAIAFRSASGLPLHISGNTVGSSAVKVGWLPAIGSSGSACNYNAATITATTVAQDAIIPATPAAPATPTDRIAVMQYVRIGGQETVSENFAITGGTDLNYIDLAHVAAPQSTFIFVNRKALAEGLDYVCTIARNVTRVTWIGPIAPGGPEQLVITDKILAQYCTNMP
jgi:hypothetical protein